MAFRTLGEAVLAAHRAEQADNNDSRPRLVNNGKDGHDDGDGGDGASDVLSSMWIVQYLIAQRPR